MVEYNPNTCITAGELRSMGIPIPESIPDCGWVSRHAIEFKEKSCIETKEYGKLKFEFDVKVHEPFHWVTATFTIPAESK